MTTVSIGGLRTLGDQPRGAGHRQSVPSRDEREDAPYWDTLEHRKSPDTTPRKGSPKDEDEDDDELPEVEDPAAEEAPASPWRTLSMETEVVRIWATDALTGETLTDAYVDVERVVSRQVSLRLPDGTTLEFEDVIEWP